MADNDQHDSRTSAAAPDAPSHPGTEVGAGGEPQVPIPPYDDLRGATGENTAATAFDPSNAPAPRPAPPVSAEERDGTSSTDLDPEPAHGVGVSRGGRAEEIAPDRPDVATKEAGRPVGKVAGDDSTANSGPAGPS